MVLHAHFTLGNSGNRPGTLGYNHGQSLERITPSQSGRIDPI